MSKILIIEDDELLRSAFSTKLSLEGFEVIEAPDGEEGLKKAGESNPDLILLDLILPNMNGIDFLKVYDLKGKHPNTKVIVFSNLSAPDKINECLALGVKRYLTKSNISPNQMVKTVKEVLAGEGT